MQNELQFKPFMAIEIGDLFKRLKSEVMMMKTGKEKAIYLASSWEFRANSHREQVLYKRGSEFSISEETCIRILDFKETIQLPTVEVPPMDPRRKFWDETTKAKQGNRNALELSVFGGLFVYSGFGEGVYYAKTMQEILDVGSDVARELAENESVPYVQLDSASALTEKHLQYLIRQAHEDFATRFVRGF